MQVFSELAMHVYICVCVHVCLNICVICLSLSLFVYFSLSVRVHVQRNATTGGVFYASPSPIEHPDVHKTSNSSTLRVNMYLNNDLITHNYMYRLRIHKYTCKILLVPYVHILIFHFMRCHVSTYTHFLFHASPAPIEHLDVRNVCTYYKYICVCVYICTYYKYICVASPTPIEHLDARNV